MAGPQRGGFHCIPLSIYIYIYTCTCSPLANSFSRSISSSVGSNWIFSSVVVVVVVVDVAEVFLMAVGESGRGGSIDDEGESRPINNVNHLMYIYHTGGIHTYGFEASTFFFHCAKIPQGAIKINFIKLLLLF